jgi:hypothetical protein
MIHTKRRMGMGAGMRHRARRVGGAMIARVRWRLVLFLGLGTSLVSACNLQVDSPKGDLDDTIDETIDKLPDIEDVANFKICGDQTLQDLVNADGLSDECRDKVESFLPEPQTNFESRIAVLGDMVDGNGARTIYFVAADAAGNAIDPQFSADLSVSATVDGSAKVLVEGEFSFELPQLGDIISLGVVNDYSASMRDADLNDVAEIEHDLFTYVPAIYEAEVTQFSEMVTVKQPFTSDETTLLSAVAKDPNYERASTALYDGMGTALTSLNARTRPVRVLLVSTDGKENASMTYMEPALLTAIEQGDVFVIMLGALFADVATLKRLSGDHGVFFYARGYGRLKSAVRGLLESFGHVGALHLPPQAANGPVTITVGGQTITLP